MSEFFYRIVYESQYSIFDFNIFLDKRFARNALQKKISKRTEKVVQSWGEAIIHRNGLVKLNSTGPPYTFVQDKNENLTYLLRNIVLLGESPENSCRLDFHSTGSSQDIQDMGKRTGEVYYISKEVKNAQQSQALLMLWLEWTTRYYFLPRYKKERG